MNILLKIPWLLFVVIVGVSCSAHIRTINDQPFEYRCLDIVQVQEPEILPIEKVFADSVLTSRYSRASLIAGNAFGLINQVREYEHLRERAKRQDFDDNLRFKLIEIEDDIDETLDLGMLELISVGNRIDCAILQLEKLKSELNRANLKSQNSLTNAAVIVGGATTVLVAGILVAENEGFEPGNAIDWIGVAGGVAAVYLALRSTKVDKRALLAPTRNVVASFENQDRVAGDFPASTWYLLNSAYLIDSTEVSIREKVLENWYSSKTMLNSEEHMNYYPVLLEGEGVYTEGMIELRINLLEAVGVGIDLILRSMYQINLERR